MFMYNLYLVSQKHDCVIFTQFYYWLVAIIEYIFLIAINYYYFYILKISLIFVN